MKTSKSITLALLISLVIFVPAVLGLPVHAASVPPAFINWSQVSSLPQPLMEVSTVTDGSHIYVVGGNDDSPYTSSVSFAQVNIDGSLGAWSATTSLPTAQVTHKAVVISNGYLFVIGGYACCWGGLTSVKSAPILSDGSLGGWSTLTALPTDLYRSAVVTSGEYLYVIGGWSDTYGSAQSSVYRASINTNGTIGDWITLTSLPNPLHAHAAVIYNDYIFVIGGMTGLTSGTVSREIFNSHIAPDGTISDWGSLNQLPIALQSHASTIWQGHIVVTGGRIDATSGEVASTYLATIQQDGTISDWSNKGDLPQRIAFHASVMAGDHIYVIGGFNGTSYQSAVYTNETTIATETPTPTDTSAFFNFTGFFQPIDNFPALNVINAGRGVAVKFSLNGYKGLDIFAVGYPTSSMVVCDLTAEDAIEQTLSVGSNSLTYDSSSDQYIYIWKTDKAWAGTCRTLIVKLSDGTYHRANFKFK